MILFSILCYNCTIKSLGAMNMRKWIILLFVLCILMCGCVPKDGFMSSQLQTCPTQPGPAPTQSTRPIQGNMEPKVDVQITCEEGDSDCYSISGSTILFSGMQQDSVYQISGELVGNIIIEAEDDIRFELELTGLHLSTDRECPIVITSGDKVNITAKKSYDNYIYDWRPAVSEEEYAGAIHSECDLVIGGKGNLTIYSAYNNGIHGKDDLQVKNLTLSVDCMHNALKGNDSVSIDGGNLVLVARQGDGIKTSNSDVSEKGKQRGTITLSGCSVDIYTACDGINAAYDVIVEDSATTLNIYTDKYSAYSETVEGDQTPSGEELSFIRFTSQTFQYAVKYYNSDSDYQWVTATYHSTVSGGRNSYYYYSFPRYSQYAKIQYFGYMGGQTPGQEEDYAFCSEYLAINPSCDTFALSQRGNSLMYEWTNYSAKINDQFGPGGSGGPGGPGGMQDGNSDKGTYSTKGIKANNAITIYDGIINITAYDDAIHANQDNNLENGEKPTGDVTIKGGTITVYSNDDGIHADGNLSITGGVIRVTNSYEGLEGTYVRISGGDISVISVDDGMNATATSGEGIVVSGGSLYIYAGGDGLDSNSRDSYGGIVFSGGNTVIITASNGNSAIDTEHGYRYTGGYVLAVTSRGGMSAETANCQNLRSAGKTANLSLSVGKYLTVSVDSVTLVTVQMPCSMNATVVFLGSADAKFANADSTSASLNDNGVHWAAGSAI